MVLGVGAGIGFGFGDATCGEGVVGLEGPGLLGLAAFCSFANRFSRICPSLLNIFSRYSFWICLPCQHRLGGLDPAGSDSDRSSWRSSRLSAVRGNLGRLPPNRNTRAQLLPFRSFMFFPSTSTTSLLNAVAGFRSGSRSFATSSALWYPKLKSHSGTKKRWRSLPNGLFKRVGFFLWFLILVSLNADTACFFSL